MNSSDVVSFIEKCLQNNIEIPKGILFPIENYKEHDSVGTKLEHTVIHYDAGKDTRGAKVTFVPERSVYHDIADRMIQECHSQDEKWGGDRTHHPLEWNAILGEERGEVEKEINDNDWKMVQPYSYEVELEQVGAVVIQMIKSNMTLTAKEGQKTAE